MSEIIDVLLKYAIETFFLLGLGYALYFLKNRLGDEQFNKYLDMAHLFVEAAEQQFGEGMGADKKIEVIQLLKDFSKDKLSDTMIENLIESAVFEMNNNYKLKQKTDYTN